MTPVSLIPNEDKNKGEPSRGKELGQQTGGTADSDRDQALRIIGMIAPITGNLPRDQKILSDKDLFFARAQILESLFTNYSVTGKQLFWLRDIKDKLVEAGVL